MSASVRVRDLCLLAIAALPLAACGSPETRVTATVTTIDRTCTIITETKSQVDDPRGSGVMLNASEFDSGKGDCKSVGEWEEIRRTRSKAVDGTAVIHLTYKAPSDGHLHDGQVTFTGLDDEFYDLRAGDSLEIRVSDTDPTKISKL